ncbi:hypothetical protein [Synechococcus sp. UW140]|nr:hypothetical protein [Synechococcus sp. UW140]
MSASQYLKRLQIEEVDEEDVGCQYLKVVQVVEVLDQEGNLFPEPNE